ncbi:type II secretion system protein GspL [Ramlibacter sp. MAHUQ-53]|uniref:type II secretion system protein GspL n=1 Tax=unclassified Ramlibacter TaxID=2617605 RepID=UPI00363EA0B3
MSSLYLLLPTAPVTGSTEFAYVLSADGRTPGASGRAAANLLPQATGPGAQVVAVVPAQALSWHRIDWPRGLSASSPRLRAALEGLLEDRLLDDPESLHFALEPGAAPGGPAWVAACDRAWLRGALQALEAAGRPAMRVVPELSPGTPTALHARGEPESAQWLVRHAEGVTVLPLSSAGLPLLPPLPEDAPCFAEPALAAHAEQLLQRPMVLQAPAQRWLEAAQGDWDLAQFEFASSGRARTVKRLTTGLAGLLHAPQWRPLRWGLVALVAAHLVGLNAWAWRERASLAAKQQAARAVLTQTFPHVKLVVDAPLQMEREVNALRQATGTAGSRDLETLLGALAAVAPQRGITALEYVAGELRVRGLGWTETDLRAAEPRLRSQGLAARLEGELLVLRTESGT